MKLQVNVTQKHIDKGQRNSYYCKPIELAMINSGVYTAFVREDAQIAFKYQGIMYYRDQPESVINFVNDWYDGKPVQPFSFELELWEE